VRFHIEILEGMGKRVMADIMKKTGAKERLHAGESYGNVPVSPDEARDHTTGNVEGAQAVASARVCGARIYQVCGPQLPYPVKLLELGVLRHTKERTGKRDMLPDRVPDRLGVFVLKMVEDPLRFAHTTPQYDGGKVV
jgi:hypothetical protein